MGLSSGFVKMFAQVSHCEHSDIGGRIVVTEAAPWGAGVELIGLEGCPLLLGRDRFAFPVACFPLDIMFLGFFFVFSKLVFPSCNRFICMNVF